MANTGKNTTSKKATGKKAQKIDGEAAVREKIAAMPEPYRAMGERLHDLILESAPELDARPWYGMPGYAKGAGPVLCYFRLDDYMTFGLTEKASFELDGGAPDQLMQCAWFFTSLDDATEARLAAIIGRAVR